MSEQDTIYALSSGSLPSGVAIVRISGSRTRFALETLCSVIPKPRMAVLKTIRDRNDLAIDKALVLFFPNPNSFTGEDCAEIHLHGGRAVVSACLNALSILQGLRIAEAGEFTKRAFDNGKMDLTEAEGLADLISAETEMQRRLAIQQSDGVLKDLYDGWAARILRSRALIEAELDFSDEDDIPGAISDQVWSDVGLLAKEISRHLKKSRAGEITRNGFSVVIAGAPNAGKSSLLNALAGRDVAIVSEERGTTRDILEVRLDIAGHLVVVKDTAGIRDTDNKLEREGIRRAEQALETADLILHLVDLSLDRDALPERLISKNNVLKIGTKTDIVNADFGEQFDALISTTTEDGLEGLLHRVEQALEILVVPDDFVVPTRQRHIDLLKIAQLELVEATLLIDEPIEIRSEHLRLAQDALGKITGRTDVEDLLGVIFGEFCVGK
ncbi:tRNA uridine-5-carboxymethylaminomethyl(34) synthesis GTPase MnmE [Lentilitoribacter sp. EG35]|uniref:tRNA uridine-5-carboxymethylaminomethyl(34) synthesis GTPase MnmE n=1 Tax=Lentilitoribacter sp. EG35 TaxID=3234192 RepID=UPI003460188F